jgi:GR25 family glycosyltransferase involved in LPS biosynthesis
MNKNKNNKNINDYLKCIDIIYWINLDRSENRRKNMLQILDNINIKNQRINAIDGKLLSKSEIYSKLDNIDYSRSIVEYACLLSHLNSIKTFNESNHQIALILEDDISLEYLEYWNKTICEIINDAPKDWEIIMLNYQSQYKLKNMYTLNYKGRISCAQAYLINKNGSNKLINTILKNNKYVLTDCNIHTADNYIFCILKTYIYKYPYFTYPTNNDSTIHVSHLDFHNYCKNIAFYAWNNKFNKFMIFNRHDPFLRIILILIIIIIYILLLVRKK